MSEKITYSTSTSNFIKFMYIFSALCNSTMQASLWVLYSYSFDIYNITKIILVQSNIYMQYAMGNWPKVVKP